MARDWLVRAAEAGAVAPKVPVVSHGAMALKVPVVSLRERDGQSHVRSGHVSLFAKLIKPEGSEKGERWKPEAGIVLSQKKSDFQLVRKGCLLKGS